MNKRILHYYVDPDSFGGPITYINTITHSYLSKKYEFGYVYQYKPIKKLGLRDYLRIINEIKLFKPDIMHIHGLQSEGFVGVLCARLAKCKKILVTVHGMENDSETNSLLKKVVFKYFLESYTLKKANYVYCVCKATENMPYIRSRCKNLIPYIWNCIGSEVKYNRSELREEMNIKKDDIIFVILGRVTVMKGFKELCQAINRYKNPRVRFYIVGDGPYLEEVKRDLAERIENGFVVITGFQSEIGRYLSVADAYISASYKENLSIALLEAGSYGLPCIATDVGGNCEIIDSSKCGIIIPPHNVDELLRAIEKISSNLDDARRIGIMLKNRINACFSKSIFLERIDRLYSNIIQNSKNF